MAKLPASNCQCLHVFAKLLDYISKGLFQVNHLACQEHSTKVDLVGDQLKVHKILQFNICFRGLFSHYARTDSSVHQFTAAGHSFKIWKQPFNNKKHYQAYVWYTKGTAYNLRCLTMAVQLGAVPVSCHTW